MLFQAGLNHALVGSPSAFESEGHSVEVEGTIRGDERGCSLVRFLYLNVMVSGVGVEETQRVVPWSCVDNLVNARQWEGVFGESLVEVLEIDTQALGFVFLWYSLRPEILVRGMDVSRRILVLDAFIYVHFCDKYFRTEGIP